MKYRNPFFTEFGTINCEVQLEEDGPWLPFHIVPGESDEMAALDAEIRANPDEISRYVAPPEPEAPKPDPERDLTPAQFEWLLAFTGLSDV